MKGKSAFYFLTYDGYRACTARTRVNRVNKTEPYKRSIHYIDFIVKVQTFENRHCEFFVIVLQDCDLCGCRTGNAQCHGRSESKQ